MASLHIPDAAYTAAEAVAGDVYIVDALHAAAPLIVAAELRRLAALLSETDDARLLVRRADELTRAATDGASA